MTEIAATPETRTPPPPGDSRVGGNFIDYKKTEINCVADLRRLRDLATKLELSPEILRRVDDVLTRIEERRFSIAVVGEFKRGKSTFINALLGKEILPADVLPCSATLNRVTYGVKPAAHILFRGEDGEPGRVEEVPVDRLAEYVTKLTPESETTAAQVQEAVVTYPSEYCRNNVDIIDTPGLNDDESMTSVTLSVIPRVDAAILVIMPEAPFAGSEGDFLTQHLMLEDLGRVMFVVTALDRLPDPSQQERILDVIGQRITRAVEGRLAEQFGEGSEEYEVYRQQIGQPHVFGLSGFKALKAQEEGDEELLEESRFSEFTDELERFLVEGRGVVELQVLVNRLLDTTDEIVKKLKLELGAMDMAQEEFDQAYDEASGKLERLRAQREEETAKIDQAAERTRHRLEPQIDQIENDLRQAAEETIESAKIDPKELKKERLPSLTEKLGKKVSQAISLTARRSGEKIQLEIERDLKQEAARLSEFAETVGETLDSVVYQFTEVEGDARAARSAGAESLAAVLSIYTGFGGIWSGYREAGAKGAAVGGVASLGTALAGGAVIGLLSLPVSLPVAVIAIGLTSIFTGKLATQVVLGGTRVENFKKSYRKAVLEQLDEQLRGQNLRGKIAESINAVYARLKEQVMGETGDTIEQTQANLDELKAKKGSDTRLSESRRRELQGRVGEVTSIRDKGTRLSLQLAEIRNV